MRYRLTTRGKIVAVVFSVLVVTAGASLFNSPNVSEVPNIKETVNNGIENLDEDKKILNGEIANVENPESNDLNNNLGNERTSEEVVSNEIAENIENEVENSNKTDSNSEILRKSVARIYFKPDKFNLAENEVEKLNKIIEIGIKFPDKVIVVEGNINGYPKYDDTDFGKSLSNKRAEVIKIYLVENGINKEMIHIFGLGSKKPIDNTSSISESWKNRRTDVYFKGYNSLEY